MHEFRAVKLAIALPDSELERARSLPLGEIALQPVEMPAMYEPPRSLTLRPENTAGVVRAYIEHDLGKRGLNKLYYIGPQFRRERPQKGRYRQFYQIGAEVIGPPSSGSDKPLRDAEVLEMLATLLNRLGVKDWKLKINSVGSSRERADFQRSLTQGARTAFPRSSVPTVNGERVTNPLRVLDCKVPADQPIIEKLPRISDYLDDESKTHFRRRAGALCIALACRLRSTTAWSVVSTTTRGLRSSSLMALWGRKTPFWEAAGMTDFLKRWAGRLRRESGLRWERIGLVLALQERCPRSQKLQMHISHPWVKE